MENDRKGMAVAALVLGIVGCVIPYLGFVLAIIAIVLGAMAKSGSARGMALAGMILGIVSLAFNVLWIVIIIGLTAAVVSNLPEYPVYESLAMFI